MATQPAPQRNVPDPVRLYSDDDHRLARTVENQLRERRMDLVEQLATCGAGADPLWMKHLVGTIAGLAEAIAICVEAQKELFG